VYRLNMNGIYIYVYIYMDIPFIFGIFLYWWVSIDIHLNGIWMEYQWNLTQVNTILVNTIWSCGAILLSKPPVSTGKSTNIGHLP
jgi:hypothetical protein